MHMQLLKKKKTGADINIKEEENRLQIHSIKNSIKSIIFKKMIELDLSN